jgi:hypothetical protein
MVTRKKTDVVQLSKIRMREELRRKLARDADRKGTTLSGEIVDRLEQSYQIDDRVELINSVRLLAPRTSEPGGSRAPWKFLEQEVQNLSVASVIDADTLRTESSQKIDAAKAAQRDRRDSDIIDVLLSRNEASSRLLRAITLELATKPDWSSSKSGISDMAEAIRLHVYSAERRLEEAENDQ